MDIGCYPISWVRHIIGEEPLTVTAEAEVGPADVDVYLTSEMTFPSGVTARTSGDMRESTRFRADIEVIGELGAMIVNNPLAPQSGNSIKLNINGEGSTERFDRRATYGYQLDAFIAAVDEGAQPLTGPEDAVKQLKVIDRCYEAAGLPLRGL
ncbi:MAG: hypothetical protein HOC70_04595 [Gammaproteobacteria bacterium]|jgi:predicted dehydrogenase|nr:hypothetical protein [Gammaproteobacteria bacterium]MBT4492501.1 hypothetical protein [Gammaproteobacteria bacterium]MBT7369010.1 hypothetical protein [Gammaproteobacteria bacterium]